MAWPSQVVLEPEVKNSIVKGLSQVISKLKVKFVWTKLSPSDSRAKGLKSLRLLEHNALNHANLRSKQVVAE